MLLLTLALAEDLPDFLEAPIDADPLQPGIHSRLLLTQDAQPIEGPGYAFRVLGQTASAPYVWIDRETGEQTVVLGSFTGMTLGGVFWRGRTRVGMDVPFYLASEGPAVAGGTALGDARISGRVVISEGAPNRIGLAATGSLLVPVGTTDSLLAPPGTFGDLGAALDYSTGRTLWALNMGLRLGPSNTLHPSLSWGNQLAFGFGGAFAATDRLDLGLEVAGHTQLNDLFGYSQGTPIELLGGAQVELVPGLRVRLAGGGGLTPGIGAPDWRAVAAVAWVPQGLDRDRDKDGVNDDLDGCPQAPEDIDGFEDLDGCPDPDNDGDGILDSRDRCRDVAEDLDGYEDQDGCPEDNSHLVVRVVDWKGDPIDAALVHVAPANEMGDVHDFSGVHTASMDLAGGRWEVRLQALGYADWFASVALGGEGETLMEAQLRSLSSVARVRLTPLDRDDQLMDEVLVTIDGDLTVPVRRGEPSLELEEGEHHLLIHKPGHVPVELDVDVLLDEERSARVQLFPDYVSLQEDTLLLTHPVDFESGTAVLTPRGEEILDQVAEVLLENPDITMVRIEGHTDNVGPDEANLELSQMRADTVRAELIVRGVLGRRMYAVGFGEDYPIADNGTEEGRRENRRVSFYVEARDDEPE